MECRNTGSFKSAHFDWEKPVIDDVVKVSFSAGGDNFMRVELDKDYYPDHMILTNGAAQFIQTIDYGKGCPDETLKVWEEMFPKYAEKYTELAEFAPVFIYVRTPSALYQYEVINQANEAL